MSRSATTDASNARASATPGAKDSAKPRTVWPIVAALGYAGGVVWASAVAGVPWGASMFFAGLGGLTVALAGLGLWRVVDPLVRKVDALPEPPRAPARVRELEREKQMVLKAIKEIELDFHMKKISEGDHRELTQRYRARAMRILAELDAGNDYRALIEQELKGRLAALASAKPVSPEAGSAGRICPGCSAPNDGDATFCKKCGRRLGEEVLV